MKFHKHLSKMCNMFALQASRTEAGGTQSVTEEVHRTMASCLFFLNTYSLSHLSATAPSRREPDYATFQNTLSQ